MSKLLGKKIKELREGIGMSQRQASKDICTQAYISMIENGDIHPSADILMKLSERFSTDISYLLDISNAPRHDYIIEVFSQIREAIYQRNYTLVKDIIDHEIDNKQFSEPKYRQFLIWHSGICAYYKDNNIEQALSLLDESLNLTLSSSKVYLSEREIEIKISKGNIYTDHKDYQNALSIYKEALIHLRSKPNISNKYLPVRLFYNYSRALRYSKEYKLSLKICDEGIHNAKINKLLYLKGDLYYQKGINYVALNDINQAIENFQLAEMVYTIESNKSSLDLTKNMLQKLKTVIEDN